jgi:uncharacterized PurR-regulated membrane protein YhhQ (DUF165 family)
MPQVHRFVLIYLAAVATANLLVSRFGPAVTPLNALLLIGLDLVARDRLHEQWRGRALWPRMIALIIAGGLLSLLLGGSSRIAWASCGAFVLAGSADTLVYRALTRRPWIVRSNGSNLIAAVVDSLAFPLLAFGWPPLWLAMLGQFGAKAVGGMLWAVLLRDGHPTRSPRKDPARSAYPDTTERNVS